MVPAFEMSPLPPQKDIIQRMQALEPISDDEMLAFFNEFRGGTIPNEEAFLFALQQGYRLEHLRGEKQFAPHMCVKSVKILELLLDAGADPKLLIPRGEWDHGGDSPLLSAILRNDVDAARMLLERGARAYVCNEDMAPILIDAIRSKNRELVELMLEYLEDITEIDDTDNDGLRPLAHAVVDGTVAIARLFLDEGVDVNATPDKLSGEGCDFETPLIRIVRYRDDEDQCEMIDLLLEYRADIEAATAEHMTALMYATRERKTDVAATFLIQKGADVTRFAEVDGKTTSPLIESAREGWKDLCSLILQCWPEKEKAKLTATHGPIALRAAKERGHDAIVTMFIEAGISFLPYS